MSPEVIEGKSYDMKSDIWSAGCLIYELANLKPPFEAENQFNLSIKIKDGNFDRLPNRYSEELMEIIKQMLITDPLKRLTASELLQSKILQLRGQD